MSDYTSPKRLALHACCGPCLIEPLDAYRAEGFGVLVVFANPNIQPREEYERRRDTLLEYTRAQGIEAAEVPYEPGAWREAVSRASSREERCRACYRLRATPVARFAAVNGFDAIASTLTVSPYQDLDAIAEEVARAAAEHGVGYVHRDFRGRYPEAMRRSRAERMYRQNYCGCGMSMEEAEESRARRREARRKKT